MSAQIAVPSTKGQLKGWHALLWFLGFFGCMFVVNGIFLWTAITTFRAKIPRNPTLLASTTTARSRAGRIRQRQAGAPKSGSRVACRSCTFA